MNRPADDARTSGDGDDDRWKDHLEAVFTSYVADRVLSDNQQRILRLYLNGANDKEIASSCGCSEATVYEHWRRMAKKVGGFHKCDVIADFHRYLGGDRARRSLNA
jgi:DNA-binding CsgD family transcriptional regulator